MRFGVKTIAKVIAALFLCGSPAIRNASAAVTVISSNPDGLSLSYRYDKGGPDSVIANGKTYLRFGGARGIPGTPGLPTETILFATPKGSVPVLSFTTPSRHIRQNVTIAPHPTFVKDGDGIMVEEYREDAVAYAMSGYQPVSFAALGSRDDTNAQFTLWRIVISPVLFDAHASTLSIADSLILTLSWSGRLAQTGRPSTIPADIINRDEAVSLDAARATKTINTSSASPFATGEWYKISISDSGMYSITGSELFSAGLAKNTAVTALRMYYGGGKVLKTTPHSPTTDDFREIAIKIKDDGNGILDANDAIVFYGESLSRFITRTDTLAVTFQNHPYSSTNIYWLTVSASGAPKRIASDSTLPDSTLSTRTSYRELLHFEKEITLQYAESGTLWGWETYLGNTSETISFKAPDAVSGDSTRIRVSFISPSTISHLFRFYINGAGGYYRSFQGSTSYDLRMSYPHLLEENSTFTASRVGGTDPIDPKTGTKYPLYLDYFEVEYNRALMYASHPMELYFRGYGIPENVKIFDVPSSSIEIYDTTDPYTVVEHSGKSYNADNRTLSFGTMFAGAVYSRFLVWPPESYLKAVSITREESSDLRNPLNGANYILISPPIFMEQGKKLTDWRSRDSAADPLTTKAVDLQDIFDEFAWGVYDPVAIRDYLFYLKMNADEDLTYCCLMGDATYKYKNISATQSIKNWVPTYTYRDVSADDFFTWFDTTQLPYLAIGRFCVNTVEEAKTAVAKTIGYEQAPESGVWRNRVLLIADDELTDNGVGQQTEFSDTIEVLDRGRLIPSWFERSKLMMIEYPLLNLLKPAATTETLARFNEGALISIFFGHGNKDLLAHEHLLVGTRDIEQFNNGGRLPLFLISACEPGQFDLTDFTSLAERLHLRSGGGCIGVFAPCRTSTSSVNMTFYRELLPRLLDRANNPETRIGLAAYLAKRAANDINPVGQNSTGMITYFGDPAQRIAIPRYTISASGPDTLPRLSKINLTGEMLNNGDPVSLSGALHVTARGPIIHKQYTLICNAYRHIDYTQPGNVFFRAELPLTGSTAALSLTVPKDVVSDSKESCIRFFVDGNGTDASGIIDSIAIGAVSPDAGSDTSGPEITLSFDGKTFSDGAYVKRTPTLSVIIADSSGVNIYGNRGHSVTATIDGTDIYILNDKIKFTGGCTTASGEYTFPQLSAGKHTIEVGAYDSYNNATSLAASFNVTGAGTGDISISDLLNYPNPMRSDGTTFTFTLTDNAGSANIKVYSQSGRLVETIRFNAVYGFNTVSWKPARELANGVYFYKLTVRSENGRKSSKTEKLVVMR